MGPGHTVNNYGHGGACVYHACDTPYTATAEYTASLVSNPDWVILYFGTNDTKAQNWVSDAAFKTDYQALIAVYQALPTHPKIILVAPETASNNGFGIQPTIINNNIVPDVKALGVTDSIAVADVFTAFGGATFNANYFQTDNVHPSVPLGITTIANTVRALLPN